MSASALGVVMLDLAGPTLLPEEQDLLRHPQVGGVILFARNIESPAQVAELVAAIRGVRQELLVAVDQEGGRVQRLREGFTRLPPMQRFGELFQAEPERAQTLAELGGWLMASEVLAMGLDLSFAPVLDLDRDRSQVIGDRAFSDHPGIAATLAGAWIDGMHRAGMAATGKHFPGHGGVVEDSHLELPVDPRPRSELDRHDLVPYRTLLSSHLDAVMPAHLVFSAIDEQPVGFSRHWLQQVLRQELAFDGVIFSDDLAMAGAAAAGDYPARARAALAAGCDMVLVCNDRAGAEAVLAALAADQYPASARLPQLRARRPVSWSALTASGEYQQAREQLASLVAMENSK